MELSLQLATPLLFEFIFNLFWVLKYQVHEDCFVIHSLKMSRFRENVSVERINLLYIRMVLPGLAAYEICVDT